MEIKDDRLPALVTACDGALERLVDIVHPEVEALRTALEEYRDDALRRLAAVTADAA